MSYTLSGNHKAKTAVHEFVHSRVHRKGKDGTTAEERECVAEGTAFIVCSYFGLDTSSYSFEYVKGCGPNRMEHYSDMEKSFENQQKLS